MFRTIVVGCDGSEHTADALALARQLRHPEGRLLLAAVHDHFGPLPDRRGGYGYERFMTERCLEDLEAAARMLPADVPAERHVLADDSPGAALDRLAQSARADLIVLGSTHRRRTGVLTGRATAQRMMHGAPCAIAAAAPGQAERFGAQPRLCVAYDGSEEADLAATTAFDIAAATGASVLLVRVIEPIVYAAGYAPIPSDLEVEERMRGNAGDVLAHVAERAPEGVVVDRRVLYGPSAHSILDAALEGGCDLLVAGSRAYGPLRRVLAGSVSSHLLTDGRVPVLVTPRGTGEPAVAEAAPEAETVS
jgi:nucleotide-binding universal stress UspA family protein